MTEKPRMMIEVRTVLGTYVGWVLSDEYYEFARGERQTLSLIDFLLVQPGAVSDNSKIALSLIDTGGDFLIVSPPVITRMLSKDERERIRALKQGIVIPQKENTVKEG